MNASIGGSSVESTATDAVD